MAMILCGCGCGKSPKYPGAKFVHGHHLRLEHYQRKPVVRPTLICKHCGISYLPKKRSKYSHSLFCSRQCSARSRSTRCRDCVNCGRSFIASSSNKINCSRKCRSEYALKRGLPGSYRYNAYKAYAPICADCGFDKEPRVLVVHHIDGVRNNGALSNLVRLCPTCHEIRHLRMLDGVVYPPNAGAETFLRESRNAA